MITLGIDPGTAILGYGLVAGDDELEPIAYGVLRTPRDQPMPERLLSLYNGVRALSATHQPGRKNAVAINPTAMSVSAR